MEGHRRPSESPKRRASRTRRPVTWTAVAAIALVPVVAACGREELILEDYTTVSLVTRSVATPEDTSETVEFTVEVADVVPQKRIDQILRVRLTGPNSYEDWGLGTGTDFVREGNSWVLRGELAVERPLEAGVYPLRLVGGGDVAIVLHYQESPAVGAVGLRDVFVSDDFFFISWRPPLVAHEWVVSLVRTKPEPEEILLHLDGTAMGGGLSFGRSVDPAAVATSEELRWRMERRNAVSTSLEEGILPRG